MIFTIVSFSWFWVTKKSWKTFCANAFSYQDASFDQDIVFLIELDKTPPDKIDRNRLSDLSSENQVDFWASISDGPKSAQILGPPRLEMELVLRAEIR